MHYVSVDNLSKTYVDKPLFKNVSFNINEGDKIALVAVNGAGKSTLLRILCGDEVPDQGTIWIHKEVNVVLLDQAPVFNESKTILDNIFAFDHPIIRAIKNYEALIEYSEEPDPILLADAMAEMDDLNAWHYETTVKQILGKLNIHKLDQIVNTLSGGQKKRIALAKVLIDIDFEHRHTLLIMDEPTNHLDVGMIEWLEHYLTQDKLTLLLVTHDRYFLDNVCNAIIEIDQQNIYTTRGNYEAYLESKSIRYEQDAASVDKAKNRFRKELEWMRKQPKARTTKSKAREENFYEWQEKAQKKIDEAKITLEIKMSRLGGKILEIKKLYKAFGEKIILDGFDYTFKRGERVGVVGKNGAGKSTFINMLLDKEKADSGKITVGDTIVFGDYSQDGLEFKEDVRVIEYVKDIAEFFPLADGSKISAAQFLERFLFTPQKQFTFISKLSGGEKKRLQLLSVLFKNPNFLILDEPTNDLDLPTLDILEEFLVQYPGCIIIVSHDRYFMDKIVDHLFVFEGQGVIRDFPGNYSQYREISKEEAKAKQLEQSQKNAAPKVEVKKNEPVNVIPIVPPTPKRKLSYKEKKALEELPLQIAALEKEKTMLELELGNNNNDIDTLTKIAEKIGNIITDIETKELEWLEISEL